LKLLLRRFGLRVIEVKEEPRQPDAGNTEGRPSSDGEARTHDRRKFSITCRRSRLDLDGDAHFVLHELHHSHPDNVWKVEQ
jgi:hypothetical protein